MDDLVRRLREVPSDGTATLDNHNYWIRVGEITHEAADRIEALEAALREKDNIAYVIDGHGMTHNTFTIVYHAALAGEKKDE